MKIDRGYATLAAAIVKSGQKENDTRFLQSEWCSMLKEICRLDLEMFENNRTTIPQQTIHLRGIKYYAR